MAKAHVRIQGLFEAHLTVSDLKHSLNFYQNVVGLTLAYEVKERNAAFLWIGNNDSSKKRSMLGLWSLGSAPVGMNLHLAFEVTTKDLLGSPKILAQHGVRTISFFGEKTTEPDVIGWIPAASIYFRDPDGHLLEYLSLLNEKPRPEIGIVPWSKWTAKQKQ
ncbi:MAG TPA: VOC family protein [Nitrosopumilaceae archaeon]|nr:VOC family protein [Nitrosopumilaceae archaeon]